MESDEFACRNYENKSQSRIAREREREKAMNDDDLTTKTNMKFTRERESRRNEQ